MKEISVNRKFSATVNQSKQVRLRGNFSGTTTYCEIVNRQDRHRPKTTVSMIDQTILIEFDGNHLVGEVYDMFITEQELVVKKYDKPTNKKSVAGSQYFRGQIDEERKKLTPILKYANCISFDQSYFTRTIGQLNIQSKLNNDVALFSGAGFGVLQAFAGALDFDIEEFTVWYTTEFRNSLHVGALGKIGGAILKKASDSFDNKRLKSKKATKTIRKHFRTGNRDLLVRDCKKDIFIPVWDISRKVIVIRKSSFPNIPIYQVIASAIFDPVYFKTKPIIEGMGVMNGDIIKNNAAFIRKNNPTLNIVSVGSPVRQFDKGIDTITREDLAVKNADDKHETDLMVDISGPYKRLECKPIDESYQFDTRLKAMEIALISGDIDV